MCHGQRPGAAGSPDVETGEALVELPRGEQMPAYLASAPGKLPRPAVVVVGDIFGARTPFYEHLAELLAVDGLDAIVPKFFFRQGPLAEQSFDAAFARKAALDERQALRGSRRHDRLDPRPARLRRPQGHARFLSRWHIRPRSRGGARRSRNRLLLRVPRRSPGAIE